MIPYVIGDFIKENALVDLGASINVLPYKIFMKLGLGDLTPTMMTIQLADRSICHQRVVVVDILVKVNKFIFPNDFVIRVSMKRWKYH